MTKDEREQLILDNIGLVRYLAMRYKITGNALGMDDLIQEGIIGLMKAIDDFDSSKNMTFISYASRRITWSFIEALRIHGGNFSVGMRFFRLLKLCRDFSMLYGRDPTYLEFNTMVAVIREISQATALAVYHGHNGNHYKEYEFEQDSYDEIEHVKDENLGTPEDICIQRYQVFEIRKALSRLETRERQILTQYYGLRGVVMNIREISEVMGLSISRVGGLKKRAELRLRRLLSKEDDNG